MIKVEVNPEFEDDNDSLLDGLKESLGGLMGSVYRLKEAYNGSGIGRTLHTPYRKYTRARRFGRASLGERNIDLYLTSGEHSQERPDKDQINFLLEQNKCLFPSEDRDEFGSKFPESDADSFGKFSFDDVNSTYERIINQVDDEAVHIGHDLGRNEEMRATLVPITFRTEDGSTFDIPNSRKSKTEVETHRTQVPSVYREDNELKPGIAEAELHIDVSSDLMHPEYEAGSTAHEIWRLAQYEMFRETGTQSDWELVEGMLSDDGTNQGHERTFRRLAKYNAYDVATNMDGFLKKNKILKNAFGPDTHNMLDLVRGMDAASFYFGVESSGTVEDIGRYIGTKRNKRKYKEASRAGNFRSPRERILMGFPTYQELSDDLGDLEKTGTEKEIKGEKKGWNREHYASLATMYSRPVREEIGKQIHTSDVAYEASEALFDPMTAEITAQASEGAEEVLIATGAYMIGKTGAAVINDRYRD